MPEPTLLRMQEITHVGFVDNGANQENDDGAFIEIWKKAETFAESKNNEDLRSEVWRISDQIGSAFRSALFEAEEGDDPEQVILTSLEQFQTAVKAALPNWLKGMPAVAKRNTKEKRTMTFDPKDLDDEAREAFEQLEKSKKEAEDAIEASEAATKEATEKLEKAEADLAAANDEGEEDVTKGLPADVQAVLKAQQAEATAAIEKAQNEAKEANEIAKAEREKRERAEFADIAKNDMGDLTTENLGDQLYEARQVMSDEAFEAHCTTLKAASEQARTATLFEETGKVASGTSGSAWDEVEAQAKAMVDKGDAPTKEQAVAKILEANSDLYDRYNAEQADA